MDHIILLDRNIPLNYHQNLDQLKEQQCSCFKSWIQPFIEQVPILSITPILYYNNFQFNYNSYFIHIDLNALIPIPFLWIKT